MRAFRPQTYCTGLPQSYANVFNVGVALRNDRDRVCEPRFESGPDRGYKNTGGNAGIFITGADNRAPALGNKLPNFVLFATARSPLVSSRLRVACLDYSYANRGSNPYPCTEIKKRPLGDFLFLGRITGLFRCASSPCKIVRVHNRRTSVRLFAAVRTAFSPVRIRTRPGL